MSLIIQLIQESPLLFTLLVGVLGLIFYFFVMREKEEGGEYVFKRKDNADEVIIHRREVAKHHQMNDLWVVIGDKVYDLTSFVPSHPGGDTIANHAGGDATIGFTGIQHPKRAFSEIHDYQIGVLPENEKALYIEDGGIVDKHNKSGDCWIVVSDRIYDVSEWMKEHPGGEDVFLEHAGVSNKEKATKSFYGDQHSKDTHSLIHQYFIGYFGVKKPKARLEDMQALKNK